MYIKSIVLDGFKSYGQRTTVGPFDREFNAITGLNGTGKSNILDSICFVLGITNLSQVRAANLQDLIYKCGQAGIKKASVSLVFDNTVPAQSPPGFEHMKELTITRQVEMGGKTKYLLNGHVAQHKKVQDLFCSVQLNVNNPNFLVMQGKITKVLNMKPAEILSMIEEAAGTRMYQKKREDCVKLMEKKSSKLQELVAVISEEIRPKLNQLREERAQYDEYCKLEREAEHLMRLYEAWQLCIAQRNTSTSKRDMEKGHAKIQEITDKIENNRDVIKTIEEEIEEAHKKASAEEASKLAELEGRLKEREKLEAKSNAAEKAAKDAMVEEDKRKKQLEKQLKSSEKDLTNKEAELNKVKNMFEELKHNDEADSEAFAASQRKFEAVSAGMEINDEGVAETLQEQLMNARSAAAQAQCEYQQAEMQLQHCQQQLKKKEKALAASGAGAGDHKEKMVQLRREIKSLESDIAKLKYGGEDQMTQLQQRGQQLTQQSRQLDNRISTFVSRRPFTTFTYDASRIPNFNHRQVHGPICRLIKVKEAEATFALEIAAGGRLYEVVVDDENVSKLLINRGNLQNRTTFVPMNKIKGWTIGPDVVKFAQNLVGAENVTPALALISYDKKYHRVMEYAFGSVLICKDFNTAKRVAFHDRIQRKCVTLEGDVVDPAGVFEGGARPQEQPMLKSLEEIMELEKQKQKIDEELVAIEGRMRQMGDLHRTWVELRDQLEVKQHELGVLEKVMQQTSHYQLQEEVQNLKQEIASLNEKLKEAKDIERKSNAKAKELEAKVKDSKGYKEQQLKQAEKEMKQLQQKADKSRENWKKHEHTYETLVLEISELKKEIENLNKQVEAAEQNLVELKEKFEEIKNEATANKEEVANLQKEIKAEKQSNAEKNREIQKRIQKKEQLLAQISEMDLQLKKIQHEVNKLDENYKMQSAKEKEYSKKCTNENVLKEAQALSDVEGRELEKRIRHSQDRRNALSRVVNSKAQTMYEHHEKQYNDIQSKIRVLERDKNKIEHAIVTMDERKKDTILKAHQQVTRDFGSIFGTLLPGSNAELRAPHGKTVLDGLEVKVSLGGVWKDNLTELSGGQRSLAALSLILAILLFKPAPLYILDEVDAALDLSHTQNIGNMLKTHFRQSQFIIVSLKDGMFNNANVLFRTQFVDGVSAVTRASS